MLLVCDASGAVLCRQPLDGLGALPTGVASDDSGSTAAMAS
ncbi:hypothetical protein WME94_42785 [Sorangium sp. So ce429]